MNVLMLSYVQRKDANAVRIGVDIGGTHISAALILNVDGSYIEDTYVKGTVDPSAGSKKILDGWAEVINAVISRAGNLRIEAIGIAMPGPFDYDLGISLIRGLAKYESLFGLNIREALLDRIILKDIPVFFGNDAGCFGLGEVKTGRSVGHTRVIAITLGTGIGACYLSEGRLVTSGNAVPSQGYLYDFPFLDGTAEDYFSARWLLARFKTETGIELKDVRTLASLADHVVYNDAKTEEVVARKVFDLFGRQLGEFIGARLAAFDADCLVVGGSISHSKHLFENGLKQSLISSGVSVPVYFSENTERFAMVGATSLIDYAAVHDGQPFARKTTQDPLPGHVNSFKGEPVKYRIFPFEKIGDGQIISGYEALADWIAEQRSVRIDGFIGVNWPKIRHELTCIFRAANLKTNWYESNAFLKSAHDVEEITSPFVGSPGSVWGTKTTLTLDDFFIKEFPDWRPDEDSDIIVLCGTGAGVSNWDVPIIYVDLPKNELQYRFRAGSVANLGLHSPNLFQEMYKRAYFVDWIVLRKHRQKIASFIEVVADGQRDDDINWVFAIDLNEGLAQMATNVIRTRPWFEPGVWGGQWLKNHIPGLPQQEVNYAWSFELIAPENGIVFESDGNLLEISFDWLMEKAAEKVLGTDTEIFGQDFPIRFDFLDCMDGGNLSIQCHPSPEYISKVFGETITQDETYYILDQKGNSGVFLGFQEDIDPVEFRSALEQSQTEKTEIDIVKYVQRMPSAKHDLFLIPNCTVHGAGVDNLVLEISATPYIFTFKMYDWMRLDLEGHPRPINIDHAFSNLDFSRKGKKVPDELLSRPISQLKENGLEIENLPTHAEHFYAIHRICIEPDRQVVSIETDGKCHVLMVVEGVSITLRTQLGRTIDLRFGETFIIPAAAKSYELINNNKIEIKIIKAFIKYRSLQNNN